MASPPRSTPEDTPAPPRPARPGGERIRWPAAALVIALLSALLWLAIWAVARLLLGGV